MARFIVRLMVALKPRPVKPPKARGPRRRRRVIEWMAVATTMLLASAAASIWGADLVGFRLQHLTMVALVVGWMMVVGKAFNGHVEGLLIDGRNRISLSRLQLFVWLVIVGCAFAIEVAHNFSLTDVVLGQLKPDGVTVPPELGLVMGVATASFVASPAILSLKTRKTPSESELADARRLVRDGSGIHPNSGRLYSRRPGARARWSDLFRGEELENAGSADPAKVQQFLVTFLLAVIYVAALWRQWGVHHPDAPFEALPGLSEGGLALLGISHAAYLGAKATPQTPGGQGGVSSGDNARIDTIALPPKASTKSAPV